MLKAAIIAAISALPLLLGAGQVNAGIRSGTMIECPVHTCGGGGGPHAKDVKFCKATNCGKGKNRLY
jgi:hypothetical protein